MFEQIYIDLQLLIGFRTQKKTKKNPNKTQQTRRPGYTNEIELLAVKKFLMGEKK